MRTYRIVIGMLLAVLLMGDAYAEAEPEEITIHIRGEHKAVISALLAAVDEGTPITGIAELDSLAATYSLMGIYHKSGFYGYRFRLTFPPGADVAAIAKAYGAYGNVSHIQAVESVKPSVESVKPVDSYFLNDRAITRIPTKVGFGMLTVGGTAVIAYGILKPNEDEDDFGDPPGLGAAVSLWFGLLVGYPVGVYLADPVESSFWMTCVGHSVGFLGGIGSIEETGWGWVAVLGGAVMASELSRLLPKRSRNPNLFKGLFGKFGQPIPRISFGLVPEPQRGLSAVATLRF